MYHSAYITKHLNSLLCQKFLCLGVLQRKLVYQIFQMLLLSKFHSHRVPSISTVSAALLVVVITLSAMSADLMAILT